MTHSVTRCRILKSINHFTRPDHVEFLAGEFFQIVVVVADTPNALAQAFVFLLKAEILLVEPDLFSTQAP